MDLQVYGRKLDTPIFQIYNFDFGLNEELYEEESILEKESMQWLTSFFHCNNHLWKQYERERIGDFCSRVHTGEELRYDRQQVCANLYLVVTIYDDLFDRDSRFCEKFHRHLIEIAENNRHIEKNMSDNENWVISCWSDVFNNIWKRAPKRWVVQVVRSLHIWFTAAKLENDIRVNNEVQPSYEYFPLRMVTIVADAGLDFIEFDLNKYLNYQERYNPTFQAALFHAKTVIWMLNDLYSYEKELRIGDIFNLIFVKQKEQNLSLGDADQSLIDDINDNMTAFNFVASEYISMVPEACRYYIEAVRRYIKGTNDFSVLSHRYD